MMQSRTASRSSSQESVSAWREGRVRSGVAVYSLDPGGPLARAGIRTGDLIVAVDGLQLSADQSPEGLFRQVLSTHEPGDEVAFVISPQAAQSTLTVAVELGARSTEGGKGDIGDDLVVYSHEVSLDHTLGFVEQYERLDLPPLFADALLGGLERFPCVEGEAGAAEETGLLLEGAGPLLPARVQWVGLMVLRRLWPVWIPLTLLSLAFVIWHLARRPGLSWGRRLAWVLVVALIGVFGLLVYLVARQKRRMEKAV